MPLVRDRFGHRLRDPLEEKHLARQADAGFEPRPDGRRTAYRRRYMQYMYVLED